MSAKLIYVDGLDGCGKTLGVNLLSKELSKHFKVSVLNSTRTLPVTRAIRNIVVDAGIKSDLNTEILLFAAIHNENYENYIKTKEDDHYIICDRSVVSWYAYQFHTNSLVYGYKVDSGVYSVFNSIIEKQKASYRVTINADLKECERRISANRSFADKIESRTSDYQECVDRFFKNYEHSFDINFGGEYLTVDNNKTIVQYIENLNKVANHIIEKENAK